MKEYFPTQLNNIKKEGDTGPENLIYDIAPLLILKEHKADVSYYYNDSLYKRETDIYEDQNKNKWYEIKKSPRRQMTVSLLAQPLFNISTVIEVPQKDMRSVSKFFSKINPKLSSIYNTTADVLGKSSPIFLSKEMNLDKTEQKDTKNKIADFLVFESIFDSADDSDRNYLQGHNISQSRNSYSFFDFDNSSILPLSHFEKWKEYQDKIGGTTYLPMAKEILSDCFPKVKNGRLFPIEKLKDLTLIYKAIFNKLIEVKTFFSGQDGEKFVGAVLKKTKYEEELKTNNKKSSIDESLANPHELVQGLLAQTEYNLQGLLNELNKSKDWLLIQINNKDAFKEAENEYIARRIFKKNYPEEYRTNHSLDANEHLNSDEFVKDKNIVIQEYDKLIIEIEKVFKS